MFLRKKISVPMCCSTRHDASFVPVASVSAMKSQAQESLVDPSGFTRRIDIPRDHDENPLRLLDNKLAGNVVDICPVGALTSKDFLFKSRPWFMKQVNSVCPGCRLRL